MRPFDHHIYALLLNHDCVVIPALGGFIATRENARIDSVRRIGIPPGRKIAFNVYLRNNDGLLAKRLVETEQVSYPEALQEIEHYVKSVTKALDKGERIVIRQVGQLQYDADKNIQFEPDTKSLLLTDAFGLSALPVHVLDREKNPSNHPKRELRSHKPVSGSTGNKNRSLVSILAVAGAILWFSLNVYLVSKDHYTKASLNPLDAVNSKENPVKTEIKPQPPVVKVETVFVAPATPDTSSVTAVTPISTFGSSAVITSAPVASTGYFAIAGVFRSRENAERMVRSLQSEGYSQAAIIENKSKLLYVSASRFAGPVEAKSWIDSIHQQDKQYWVYHQ